jgi:hypothetical protein
VNHIIGLLQGQKRAARRIRPAVADKYKRSEMTETRQSPGTRPGVFTKTENREVETPRPHSQDILYTTQKASWRQEERKLSKPTVSAARSQAEVVAHDSGDTAQSPAEHQEWSTRPDRSSAALEDYDLMTEIDQIQIEIDRMVTGTRRASYLAASAEAAEAAEAAASCETLTAVPVRLQRQCSHETVLELRVLHVRNLEHEDGIFLGPRRLYILVNWDVHGSVLLPLEADPSADATLKCVDGHAGIDVLLSRLCVSLDGTRSTSSLEEIPTCTVGVYQRHESISDQLLGICVVAFAQVLPPDWLQNRSALHCSLDLCDDNETKIADLDISLSTRETVPF